MSRSEFCIVNQLDATRVEIDRHNRKSQRVLAQLRDLVENNMDTDSDAFEQAIAWIDEIDGYADEIQSSCEDLDDMVNEADDFARENLDAKFEEGRDSGYDDGFNDGMEQSEGVDDCIAHYEDLLWAQFEECYAGGDVVDYHVKAKELRELLQSEKFEQ